MAYDSSTKQQQHPSSCCQRRRKCARSPGRNRCMKLAVKSMQQPCHKTKHVHRTWQDQTSSSPNHIVSNSGPLTLMKFAWHSLAMALANRVFPHPAHERVELSAYTPQNAARANDSDIHRSSRGSTSGVPCQLTWRSIEEDTL